MTITRKSVLAFVVVLGLTVWSLAGCGGGGGNSISSGTGQIQVSLVDAPLNADEINVDITSVQAHTSGSGWVTIKQFETPLHVNLLDYSSSGASLLLADSPLAAGHYTMLRLMLASAEIVIGGQSHQVDLSNVAQTGVKCNGQFNVQDGQLIALTLDFNAAKSFINNPKGSNNYKLSPVMVMSPNNIASEVTGIVEFKDAGGNVTPVPEGTMVNVYAAGHVGDAANLISGSLVGADGSFRISILPQGTYDFDVVANGVSVKQVTGAVVTPPATDLGTITIQETPQ